VESQIEPEPPRDSAPAASAIVADVPSGAAAPPQRMIGSPTRRPNLADTEDEISVIEVRPKQPDPQPAAAASTARELSATAIAAPRTSASRRLGKFADEVESKVVVDTTTSIAIVEEYRRLAASLHQLHITAGLRTLMVSSALPRDGKTLTSTNLALTLAESFGRRVLLIDADLRRPSIHNVFNLPNSKGLADGLRSTAVGTPPLIEVSNQLTVLPAGTPDQNPLAGLTSERMQAVIKGASERFDWVIIDTPPIGLISDANLMADLVDGVLLVIGAGTTAYAAVARAVAAFGRERIVGVVLNRVTEINSSNEHYRDYYYRSTAE
jgi:capsular exopolysaccharide synthesis family protein